MDIRSFFSAGGGSKPKSSTLANNSSNLTKLKNSKDKNNKSSKDENGNKTASKREKADEGHKHDIKSGSAKQKKNSKLIEPEEVIEIDEDSSQELKHTKNTKNGHEKKEKEKPKRKQDSKDKKKKSVDKSFSDQDEIDGECVKPTKGKKRKIEESEEEEAPIICDDEDDDDDIICLKNKKKKRSRKMKKLLDSDSEDETPSKKGRRKKNTVLHIGSGEVQEVEIEKPVKKTFMDKFVITSPSPQKQSSVTKATKTTEKQEKKQEVNAAAFFGSYSVHRVERKPVEKPEPVPVLDDVQDVEMHSDEEFEKTLELLDDDALTSVKIPPPSTTEIKPISAPKTEEKTSLASKLANKAKTGMCSSPEKKAMVLVPDTPGEKKPSPIKKSPPKRSKMEFVASIADKKSPNKPSPSKTADVSTPQGKDKKPSPLKSEQSGTPKGGGYRSYLNRAPPHALGSKEIPQGAENCLEGLTFVITGVLESLERDEAGSLVARYGGKVTGSLSKKTDYIVIGRDAGPAKLEKAEKFNTKQLDEDGLLELIRTRPGKVSKYVLQAEQSVKKEMESTPSKLGSFKREASKTSSNTPPKVKGEPSEKGAQDNSKSIKTEQSTLRSEKIDQSTSKSDRIEESSSCTKVYNPEDALLWVDKYKPTQLKQIIGQSGDKSNCKKLLHWLTHWHQNQSAGIKPSANKFFGKGGSDDGAGFKAALLSGPPGIGKTTTATLVCKEAGFSYVELNASDTRNAKSLKEVVAQSVGNTSMVDYMSTSQGSTHGQKHCLIMDEVDGMSGNEDRGGMQELVNIIKNSRIPIITMCNDRSHPKIRTLSNYCFDLRFQRPRVEQIKAAVMSIAFKEGIKIPPPAVNEIILASNQDIRQVIHNLAMFTADDKAITYDQVKKDSSQAKKDMKIGPFDVCRKVFVGGEETNKMTLNDKSDLFFHDYNIAPLFVQENYIHVQPYAARGSVSKHLSLLSRTADSLCDSDLVEKQIRSNQAWSLLPLEAMYASVLPGEYMRGNISQMINFPGWLGKNSTTGKNDRILQELRTHMRLKVSGDKRALNLDYLPSLRYTITEPLVMREGEGVPDVIKMMDEYDIIKEDFDNILEITKWPNSTDPLIKLSSKTKAAFTRTYNKEVHMTPYSTGNVTKKKGRGGGGGGGDDFEGLGEEEEAAVIEEEEEEEEDDLEVDTMIKKKTAASKTSATTGKGKGPAKGKGAAAKGAAKGKGKR